MDGVGDDTSPNAALPRGAPSQSLDALRQQSNQLSPSRNPSKVSKSSLSIHRAISSQETGKKPVSGSKNKLTMTRTASPTANRIEKKNDGTPQEGKLLRKPAWTGKEMRTEIVPDGNSAGRDGRKFTVANVGLNGKMYLRPTIRPANQRYAQPQFSFPITPPSSAGLDALVARKNEEENKSQAGNSLWTPTRSPSTPTRRSAPRNEYFQSTKSATLPRAAHKRAHSYSTTVDDQYSTLHDGNEGTFKIVIERPGSSRGRPRTATQLSGDTPTLEVPIPSYKLGTPRFSKRGTAFIRGSSYHGSHDDRSSILTMKNALHPLVSGSDSRVSRRHSHGSPSPNMDKLPSPAEPPSASPAISHVSVSISPGMYNKLTFKPECDDPSVVRYTAGSITAAVPARLISEITSPCFLDYDLLSDFFLTFRSYLSTSDLLLMLISRLDWALERDDEVGMIVRVRTFVAIRHWILNYFMDDFVVDYNLRTLFCETINNLVAAIKEGRNRKGNQLKIVEELKKCWRRTCALYWDSPDFGNDVPAEVPLKPGGIYGHRNADLTPAIFGSLDGGPPQLDDFLLEQESSSTNDFFAQVQRATHFDWAPEQTHQSESTPATSKEAREDVPMSPESRPSIDAISCSFPKKAMKAVVGSHPRPVAHPSTSSSEWNQQPPIATTPKALTGKRVRPANSHKRNGSFSDSMRDERARQPVQTAVFQSTEFLMTLPLGGSLVRGNLFPPGKALVEAVSPTTPSEISRATLSYPHSPHNQKGPSAMSGPGMRKLIGSVRRALGTRSPGASSPTVSSFPKLPLSGTKGATTNRLPGTAVVPQGRIQHFENQADGCLLRMDLLGAGIAEDFKRAVQEDADADSNERSRASNANTITSKEIESQALQTASVLTPARPSHNRAAPSELTAGSKSILIVDDTVPFPDMSGALPIVAGSVDTFSDAYLRPSAGPTPPLTPPEQVQTTPRRSSEILGERRHQFRSLSLDRTPSLVQDVRSPSDIEQSPPIGRSIGRPSVLSYGRSFRSKRSMSLRRYASFQSGFTRQTRQRSFDATTYTEDAFSQGVPSLPPPLHVLRRRPGGDLRAVANVGDLEPAPLRRHRSLGSISTYDESIRSSYMLTRESADLVSMMSAEMPHANAQTFSLGALAESSSPAKGQQPSLCSTSSSKPVMRPSFEKEAAKLAQIPDDDFDDGGVESALLKLEGKYEQRRSDSSRETDILNFPTSPHSLETRSVDGDSVLIENEDEDEEKRRHRLKHVDEEIGITKTPPLLQTYRPEMPLNQPSEVLRPAVYQPRGLGDQTNVHSFYNQESDPSYSSIPLLERGITDDGQGRRNKHDWSHTSILREPSDERQHDDDADPDSSHPSYDFVNETDSMKRIARDDDQPAGVGDPSSPQSFLASDSDNDHSDLSSEMSIEVISNRGGVDNPTSLLPPHPPKSNMKSEQLNLEMPRSPLIHENQLHQSYNSNPLTPIITPTTSTERNEPSQYHPGEQFQAPYASRQTSIHLPFVLAFPSSLLAQQFTIIEKDALNEIDWKELIEMRWKNVPTPALSWVSFLRTASPRGVEVVIARFNIMVKWAVSEVVLTASIGERARCISKFIHIAAHCRRLRNFATLYQLTVAMTSNELSRLANTWALVSDEDRKTLRELETLVQPTRNFYALRVEMERLGMDDACIPFIGVYTQDLLWSAQRPSIIEENKTGNSDAGPLINFEKCRIQAGIIKSLLRLLEASSLYTWGPVEGVTERCLWMARLSDEEIRRRVDDLE